MSLKRKAIKVVEAALGSKRGDEMLYARRSKLIVGLGNPGEQFKESRHNVGFRGIDYFAEKFSINLIPNKKKTIIGHAKHRFFDEEVNIVLLKPQTFSNFAEEAILFTAVLFKVAPRDLLILYDDIRLPRGSFSYDNQQDSIVHNGIQQLSRSFKQNNFLSFSSCGIGIGPKPQDVSEKEFYLGNFSEEELQEVEVTFQNVYERIKIFADEKNSWDAVL